MEAVHVAQVVEVVEIVECLERKQVLFALMVCHCAVSAV